MSRSDPFGRANGHCVWHTSKELRAAVEGACGALSDSCSRGRFRGLGASQVHADCMKSLDTGDCGCKSTVDDTWARWRRPSLVLCLMHAMPRSLHVATHRHIFLVSFAGWARRAGALARSTSAASSACWAVRALLSCAAGATRLLASQSQGCCCHRLLSAFPQPACVRGSHGLKRIRSV